ncbi:GNAT family N-acetyltransferase [Hymenobacter terricola]|uniref:GNAT family N-acetyltransferase n=1 Tax=Hymenobacter terricola TaxID=2819236 RepID=UPI001B308BD0|nr:GNAT family N-acetyltransferase [Hymenobacter terricola]
MLVPHSTRRLIPADGPDYRRLRLEALSEHPASFGSSVEEEQNRPSRFEKPIQNQDPDAFVVGAFVGEELVGMCGFVREPATKTRHRGLIVSVYVRSSCTRQGLGRQMLAYTIAEAFDRVGVRQLELGVTSGNAAANRLYEQAGFVEFGLMPNYLKLDGRYYNERLMVLNRLAGSKNNS